MARKVKVIFEAGIEIRPCSENDLEDLYEICVATGASGADASRLYADRKLIGHIYAAPYALYEPQRAFVVEDDLGVGGYILGALDTRAFEALLEEKWWPRLRPRYADPSAEPAEQWTPDERLAWQIHHPWRTPRRLSQPFPSHLHIDLLPRLQGKGVGRALVNHWLAAAKAAGATGAHLGVGSANLRAMRFYRAYGWRELSLDSSAVTWFTIKL